MEFKFLISELDSLRFSWRSTFSRLLRLFALALVVAAMPLHAQIIRTIAGNGLSGPSGDGGPATSAGMSAYGMAVDAVGNIYFADYRTIRKIDGSGVISTFAGTGAPGAIGDGGPAIQASIMPSRMTFDSQGNLFFIDHTRIRKIDQSGVITTIAGGGLCPNVAEGPVAVACIGMPLGIAVDNQGNIFIATQFPHDYSRGRVAKISTAGMVVTVAGWEPLYYPKVNDGDGGPAVEAFLWYPQGLAFDSMGNLYVSDIGNSTVRKIRSDGIITRVAGVFSAGGAGSLDGFPATATGLSYPYDIRIGSDDTLYILESGANKLSRVTADGIIRTFAGSGLQGYDGDYGLAKLAKMNWPVSMALDNFGRPLIADGFRIRRVFNRTEYFDHSGNKQGDILWRNAATGANWFWDMNGTSIAAQGAITTVGPEWQVQSAATDFNGDGKADILLRNMTTGQPWVWFMDGNTILGGGALPTLSDLNWIIAGTGDLNGDGKADVIWRNTVTGQNWWWSMNGTTIVSQGALPLMPPEWQIQSTLGDFNGDDRADILWRNMTTGQPRIWFMNGGSVSGSADLPSLSDPSWTIAGTGDLNGDGKSDVVWRNIQTGENWWWAMNGGSIATQGPLTNLPSDWQIQSTSLDLDGDGKTDILLRNMTTGQPWVWLMNGNSIKSSASLPTLSDLNWQIRVKR